MCKINANNNCQSFKSITESQENLETFSVLLWMLFVVTHLMKSHGSSLQLPVLKDFRSFPLQLLSAQVRINHFISYKNQPQKKDSSNKRIKGKHNKQYIYRIFAP